MRRMVWMGLALLLVATPLLAGEPGIDYVDGVLVVRFAEDLQPRINDNGMVKVGDASMDRLLQRFDAKGCESFFGQYRIQDEDYRYLTRNDWKFFFPEGSDMEALAAEAAQFKVVEDVCPDWLYVFDYEPNDPSYTAQWWLRKIDAPDAWNITRGDTAVLVGALDTGIDWNHPDLIDNIWVNPGEDIDDNHYPVDTTLGFWDTPGTFGDWDQIDNDDNGFINDFIGWDFVASGSVWPGEDGSTPDNNPMDFNGHGTGCYGAMAAVSDNGVGGASVAYESRMMSLRSGYTSSDGVGRTSLTAAANALAYAVDKNVDIINMSFGGNTPSNFMDNAIQSAWNNNVLLFGAAGNDGVSSRHYPADYDNVISVAALNSNDQRSGFSNWGNWVDVAAPGENCFTPWFDDGYDSWQGTSVASPIAAGVGALVISMFPEAGNSVWSEYVISTTDPLNTDHPVGSGRVNAYQAITQNYWPELVIESWSISDPDGNGHPDVGEEVEVTFELSNAPGWQEAELIMAEIDFTLPGVDFGTQSVMLGNLAPGASIDNLDNPLTFTVPEGDMDGIFNQLDLSISCGPNEYEIGESVRLMLGTPPIIFVDDDGGDNLDRFLVENLDEQFYNYLHWDVAALASAPSGDYLSEFEAIVWMTGEAENPLSDDEITALETAMDNDVNLFLFGQTLDEQLSGTSFYSDYLYAQSGEGVTQNALDPVPGAGGPVIENGSLVLVGPGGASNSVDPDVIEPITPAVAAYQYFGGEDVGGIFYDGETRKHVYFAFAFEAVSGAGSTTPRLDVVNAIITDWWDLTDVEDEAEPVAVPGDFAIASVYPNPFNPATTVEIAVPRTTTVEVAVYDLLGREVATLHRGSLAAGAHSFSWSAEHMASGLYFAVMQADGQRHVARMMLTK